MTNQPLALSREDWLTEAANFILDDILAPAGCHRPTTRDFRVSVGFPSNRATTSKNSTVLASCWKAAASDDNTNEIFVSPIVDDSIAILASLTHELIHYSDDCESGHRGHFARSAKQAGLIGPMTATQAGPSLTRQLEEIVATLGNIPHSKITPSKSGTKKQATRMVKVECYACAFSFRTTQKHIAALPLNASCPACGRDALNPAA